ncbi:MAG TPA: asparaginase [Bacillales bacterium]|nr:asparaginase [Bacillales bacterium]
MDTIRKKPVNVYRGPYIESTHDVHVAVVNDKQELLYFYGDPERLTFARSSMKPFQAVPLVETGAAEHFFFNPKDLALACASHSGEAFHRSGVYSILDRIDLPENALQCGSHVPRDQEGYEKHIREGGKLTPVFSNCSGKHSGMLTTAVHMKEDPDSYREVEHPVQQRILEDIAEICDYPKAEIAISVDGCGVPVHQLPLKKTAFGYARLAHPEGEHAEALAKIRDAMMAHPEMVGGTNRFDTDVMKAFNGNLVAKGGAEGVQCIGVVDRGLGIIVKVEDGNGRATSAVSMEVLKQLGIGDEAIYKQLEQHRIPPVKNVREDTIGKIEADFQLEKAQ